MRTIDVIRSLNPADGGTVEGVTQSAMRLMKMGVDVRIVTGDAPDDPWIVNAKVPVVPLGPSKGVFGYNPAITKWLIENAATYDVAIGHGIWQHAPLAVSDACRVTGHPYLVYAHGMLAAYFDQFKLKRFKKSLYWRLRLARVLREAHYVLFTTQDECLEARRRFLPYHVNERVVTYGSAGIPTDALAAKAAFFGQFPELEGKTFYLYLSRMHMQKGCDLLLKAFASLDHSRDTHLVMAGPDHKGTTEILKGMAQELGVADRVSWLGLVTGDAKWGAYLAADAFVLPSHHESFGMVVAEALSCGTPVLITNKVAIWREVVESGAGMAEPNTVDGIRTLMVQWEKLSEQERAHMRELARPAFLRYFEAQKAAEALLQAIDDTFARR